MGFSLWEQEAGVSLGVSFQTRSASGWGCHSANVGRYSISGSLLSFFEALVIVIRHQISAEVSIPLGTGEKDDWGCLDDRGG